MRLYYCVDPAGIVAFTRVALSTCRRPKSNFLSVFHPQPLGPVRHGSRSSPTTKSAKNGRRESWERTAHGTTDLGGWTTEDGWVRQARRIPVRERGQTVDWSQQIRLSEAVGGCFSMDSGA